MEEEAVEPGDLRDTQGMSGVGFGVFELFRRGLFRDKEAGIGRDVACWRSVTSFEQAAWRFGFQ